MTTPVDTRAGEPVATPEADPRLMHRVRLIAVSLALAALAFVQDPGRIAADTKLDLAVDPGGFLQRSLTLWEPLGFFGQLQNQAYGYLFPTGPFFVLGDIIGIPAWVTQRLWWSVILIAAFLGVVRLARLLGMTGDMPRIVAGLAYALAPRMVTEIGVLTSEVLPYAMAPWVLIPLVQIGRGTYTARRGAAWSGVAVLLAGGVNAVATAAVLPLGALWILIMLRGRVRLSVLGWWTLSVALAVLWWAIPLLLLGRYSPPFLDWIESSSVTTLITSPDTVLRGTSQWVAYVAEPGGPSWPGGWQLVTVPALILVTGLVAALGLIGLSVRGVPARAFLVTGVLVGVVLVSLGHTGVVQGFGAGLVQEALDGVLAPLRNTHKFDPVLRLPLALGVGFAAAALARRVHVAHARRWIAAGMVGLLVAGAWPMVTGSLVRDRSFEQVPDYWVQVADWLADNSPDGRALVVPGASFGIYSWGRTQDEPLQPLARSAWAVRDAVPLSSAGNIRWLDAIQERLDSGRGSQRLADALARAGVEYVVVRNDIDRRRSATPRTVLIRQALIRSGGFTPVVGFGPALPPFRTATTVVDDGLQDTVAAVEIWRVDSPVGGEDPRITLRDASTVTVLSGSAESVIDLADGDVLGERAVVISGDEAVLADAGIALDYAVSDGFRRSEVSVGSTRDNRSQTLRADEAYLQDRRVHDYYPVDPEGRQAVAVFEGGTVTASSSGSDVTALRARSSAAQPWAALDGDPDTAWISGDLEKGVGQWWEVTADAEFTPSPMVIRLRVDTDDEGAQPVAVRVTTDAGSLLNTVAATEQPQELWAPVGSTRTLRLTLESVADGGPGEAFGLAEVSIPGLGIDRFVAAPGAAAGGPIVLTARRGDQAACATVADRLVCSEQLARVGEERTGIARIVQVGVPTTYRVRMRVHPRAGEALNRILEPANSDAMRAVASSALTDDPAGRPQVAVDGSLSTAWLASPNDSRPELTISWRDPIEVRGVRLSLSPDLAASRPLRVTVTVNDRETTDIVSARGSITVPAQEATSLTIRFDNADTVRSLDSITGESLPLPIGVSEVRILGPEEVPKGPRLVDDVLVPCGFGPDLAVDDRIVTRSAVAATVSEVTARSTLRATACEGELVTLGVGAHVIEAKSTAEFIVDSVILEPVDAAGSPSSVVGGDAGQASVKDWGPTSRAVSISADPRPRLLETSENINEGWQASIDGTPLTAVRVDGWRQGWIVPPGTGGSVTMSFAPQGAYVAGLLGGVAAAIVLVVMAVIRRRPGATADDRVPRPDGGPSWILAMGAVVVGALVGGVVGLAAALVGIAAAAGLGRPLATGILAGSSACAAAVMPWPGRLDAPGWLLAASALTALGALGALAAPRLGRSAGEPSSGPVAPAGTTKR